MSANDRAWRPMGGSVRGSSHVAGDRPNEDAWAMTPPGAVAAVAVADGHGSERCPRAGAGAALAVNLAVECLSRAAADAENPSALEVQLRTVTGPDLIARWRKLVLADVAERPFAPEEVV